MEPTPGSSAVSRGSNPAPERRPSPGPWLIRQGSRRCLPLTNLVRYARLLSGLALAGGLAGCAVLPRSEIPVDGAPHAEDAEVARISIHPGKPVLLRAVDEKLLASIQISNYLRPLTYVLRPGTHVLWLSEPPAGIPFLPQRVNCHVMSVNLAPGTSYVLELDSRGSQPTLRRVDSVSPDSVGVVVDRPLLIERGCKWQ